MPPLSARCLVFSASPLLNAVFKTDAEQTLGTAKGDALFQDLREREDPEAPTTADTSFPYMTPGPVDPNAVAVSDAGTVNPYDPLTLIPQGGGSGPKASSLGIRSSLELRACSQLTSWPV